MDATDVCFAPVLTIPEAYQHPHNIGRDTFVEVASHIRPGDGVLVYGYLPAARLTLRPWYRDGTLRRRASGQPSGSSPWAGSWLSPRHGLRRAVSSRLTRRSPSNGR